MEYEYIMLCHELFIVGHGKVRPGHLSTIEIDELLKQYPNCAFAFQKIEKQDRVSMTDIQARIEEEKKLRSV